jgi:hypothetical protein
MTQVCDNEKAVTAISKPIYNPTRMLDPEMDLILAIQHERSHTKNQQARMGTKRPYRQSQGKPQNHRQGTAQHNSRQSVWRGKKTWTTHIRPYDGSGAMLIINGKWVTTEYKTQIQTAIMKPKHRAYFQKKFKHADKTVYDNIAWKIIGQARHNLTHELNSRLSKYMYNWLNTGHQKELFGEDGTCPC